MSGLGTVVRTHVRRRYVEGDQPSGLRGVSSRALCIAVVAAGSLGVLCGVHVSSPAEATSASAQAVVDRSERTVEVAYGDTLWALAKRHGRSGDVYRDMGAICELNGLTSSQLQPGQILRLP